jgi:3-oxosteroid 1-dehydrogenase
MNSVNWDFETDLVVIGTGSAGLTAAIVADHEGLDVIVLEKELVYGGTTALSGGVSWVPNNPLMKKAGIDDNPDDAMTYLKHNIGNRVAEAKLQAFVDNAPKMADYLIANSAMEFVLVHGFPDYRPETPGGSKGGRSIDPKVISGRRLDDYDKLRKSNLAMPGGVVGSVTELRRLAFYRANPLGLLQVWKFFPRNLWNKIARREHISSGGALIARLRLTLQQKNVPFWLETPLEELLVEEGCVIGVRAIKDGKSISIRARKGVMIAAGGFEQNPAMRRQFFGEKGGDNWNDGTYTSGSPGNTGDGINAGADIGAAMDLMDDMWWMPSVIPPSGTPAIVVFERGLPNMMIVNARGERFANEARPYNELGRIIYEDNAPPTFIVFDHEFRTKYAIGGMLPGITPERYIEDGYVKRADTLEELAGLTGIDAAGLAQTVSRFNDMAVAGKDEDFHKGESAFDLYAGDPANKPNPCLGPVAKAPFYAMEIKAGDLGTKGGLVTNEQAQVLREDGTVVPGLYAAGNSSASVMGNFYPGAGGTIGAAMTYGYIAAMDAKDQ